MRRTVWIAVLVLALDRLTKLAAERMTSPVTLVPGVVGLQLSYNTGAAFSLFQGCPWLLGVLSLALVAAGALVLRRYRLGPWTRTAAMLMLGGALGNAVDRLFAGRVTDMVEVLAFRFAVFNLADAALVIGCALMAWTLWHRPQEWEAKHG